MPATNERPELDGRAGAILVYAGDGALEFVQLHAPAHLDQLATLAGTQCDLAVRPRGGGGGGIAPGVPHRGWARH